MLRKQNGLTLIALIITIIVMIILAGVSLSLTTGDDGVLNKSKLAKEETRAGQVKDVRDLWISDKKISDEIGVESEHLDNVMARLKKDGLLTDEEIEKIKDPDNVNKEVTIGNQTISFKYESSNTDSNTDFDDGGLGYTQADIDNTLKYFTFDKSTGILTSKDDVIGTYRNRKNVPLKTAVFPKEIEGVVVKEIRSTLDYGWGVLANINDLEKVIILSEITKFGDEAFIGCTNLKSVELPNTLINMGYSTFGECTNLTSIKIPSSVTSIDSSVFYGCANLTSIKVDEANTIYDSRENCNAIIKTSTNELIRGCKNTTIPSSVTSIGSAAFSGCTSLTNIIIPNNVTSIEYSAFSGCTSLTNIIIPNNVTSIEGYAFSGCTGLTNIIIPSSVTSIDGSVFYGCVNLTNIEVDEANTIYDSRENCNAIIKTSTNKLIRGCKNTIIPSSVTSIGSYAFNGCTSLINITIPSSVTSIGYYAFSRCTGLTNITIPSSVTSIEYNAFYECENLEKVYFKQTTKPSFGSQCFYKSSGVKTTYYFKNSTVANAFTTSHYNASYGTKSTDYNWQ